MSDTPETLAMREALQFLIRSDIPTQHKRVLIEAVTQALTTAHAESHIEAMKKTDKEWQAHEMQVVAAFLENKVAGGWQHADEIVMQLARELHRDPDDVRRKATELGFGIGVDYRLARARVVSEDD